jgi:hypothetical protein
MSQWQQSHMSLGCRICCPVGDGDCNRAVVETTGEATQTLLELVTLTIHSDRPVSVLVASGVLTDCNGRKRVVSVEGVFRLRLFTRPFIRY